MYCMQCFLKSKYNESRTLVDKNRWIIKKVMVFKKLLQHPATRGTYSPGDWRCDEAWRAQTLGVPSSDVPVEVDLLHMRIERYVVIFFCGCVSDMVVLPYSVIYYIYISGILGPCFNYLCSVYWCSVYGICKRSDTLWPVRSCSFVCRSHHLIIITMQTHLKALN